MKNVYSNNSSVKTSKAFKKYGVPEDKLHDAYVRSFVDSGDADSFDYVCFIEAMLEELDVVELSSVFEFASKFFTAEQLHTVLGPCMDELGWRPGSRYTLMNFIDDEGLRHA